jgi:nicotinate-nucleotide pyrophosphorylase (carboxylating)
MAPDRRQIADLVARALAEDVGPGDVTTAACVPADVRARGRIVARKPGVLCGLAVAEEVFRQVDPETRFEAKCEDGAELTPNTVAAEIEGRAASLLTAERVALNFLQRLSGVATLARQFTRQVEGTGARLVDTRKTTPGLRVLEKYAVRCGGGHNHRFGLYDGVLIKDNHIAAAGGVSAAVTAARTGAPHTLRIEVEVETLAQLDEALDAGATVILLDNMSVDLMREAVARRRPGVLFEASGNMTLDRVRAVAETGVDLISVGALTHSAPALDLGLELGRQ